MQFEENIEYKFFPMPFLVLTLCGAWHPEKWSPKKKLLYRFVTISTLVLDTSLFASSLINVIITRGTDEFDSEDIFATIVLGVGTFKKINVLVQRSNMMVFIYKYMGNVWHQPRSLEEKGIHNDTLHETRWVTFVYGISITTAIVFRSISPIIKAGTFFILPLNAWYPYRTDNIAIFSLTYMHQIISGVTLTCMTLSTDTLIVSLMLQIRYQLDILKIRLKHFGDQRRSKYLGNSSKAAMTQHIREHESIYRFGCDLQKTFKPILMGQMIVVVPSIIINVYFLSVNSQKLDLQYFITFIYASTSLMQIYMFCWYGNEILLGSIDVGDALYECNWSDLDQTTKKILLTMLTRTTKSFELSASAVIPLNVDSFIKIMKTSYSAFNLLQQTSA